MFGTRKMKTFVTLMCLAVAGMADAHFLPTTKEFREIFENPKTAIIAVDLQHCFGDPNMSGELATLGGAGPWRAGEMDNLLNGVESIFDYARSLPEDKQPLRVITKDFHPKGHISYEDEQTPAFKATFYKKTQHDLGADYKDGVAEYQAAIKDATEAEASNGYHVPESYLQIKWPNHCQAGKGVKAADGTMTYSTDVLFETQTSSALIPHDRVKIDDAEQMASFKDVEEKRAALKIQLATRKVALKGAQQALDAHPAEAADEAADKTAERKRLTDVVEEKKS